MKEERIQCLIVDDEPPARELIASYVQRFSDLEIVDSCGNALEAFSVLQRQQIDLMFLDINMPKMTGLELIKSLRNPPKIVLTTAYKEYAIEGFELDVMDYLVKPVSFERFMKTIDRFHQYLPRSADADGTKHTRTSPFDTAYIFLKVNKDHVKVHLKDIQFVEGLKDYVKVVTHERAYVVYNRMSYMEEVLPDSHFVRIHKSYIISMAAIATYRSDAVRIGEREIPVGRSYRTRFKEAIEDWELKET